MLPWHCLIYYFSIVLYCVIKCSCHPWITYESDLIFFYFFTYGKSVLVNTLNVVNHSHSYIHKQSICIIVNSLGCQGYSLKFANQSKYRSEYCRQINSFFPTLMVVFTRDWKKSSTPASVCEIRIDQTFLLGLFCLMKVYVVNGFTVQCIDNINISYIVLI
jgi:hypothetical protein